MGKICPKMDWKIFAKMFIRFSWINGEIRVTEGERVKNREDAHDKPYLSAFVVIF